MRVVILTFICALLLGCTSTRKPEAIPPVPELKPLTSVPEFSIESLSKENRKDFESTLTPSIRKVFDEAGELKIFTGKETFTVNDASERKTLLDAIYWDLANSFPPRDPESGIACKETGPRVSAAFVDDNLLPQNASISLSYGCGWFDVSYAGKASSHLLRRDKFLSQSTFFELMERHKLLASKPNYPTNFQP